MTDTIKRLRIYTDEAAYFGDQKVFEVVTTRARAAKVAGGTVFQAIIGFGHTPQLHRRHLLDDVQSIVIEILDEEIKLRDFVGSLSDLEHLGPITLETVEVLRWPSSSSPANGDT
ncbi:DUF190 domain-containing protein [Brevundimonas sp.]|uniref:DUF190 domain-containing protein n=1 Tax=Brevundimonas sp. TaxID=1871086 RepID=UPI002730A41A|nr:DUF190 domain-containing protein [Brevundimonas sp.]MDP1912105.1 DUF190 domain-containing protein [Brevundimonas sp.]